MTQTHVTPPTLPLRTDAVDLLFLQPLESIHCAHSEGSREGRGDHYSDDIERPDDSLMDIIATYSKDNKSVTEANECLWKEDRT